MKKSLFLVAGIVAATLAAAQNIGGGISGFQTTGTGPAVVMQTGPTILSGFLSGTTGVTSTDGNTVLNIDNFVNTGIGKIQFRDETPTVAYQVGYRDSTGDFRILAGTSFTNNTGIIMDSTGTVNVNPLLLATKYQAAAFTFSNIGTTLSANGMFGYCSDCTIANPCAGSGTGAFAKRLNGVNVCN